MKFDDIILNYDTELWNEISEAAKDSIKKDLVNSIADNTGIKTKYKSSDLKKILSACKFMMDYIVDDDIYEELINDEDYNEDELTIADYLEVLQTRAVEYTSWFTAEEFYNEFIDGELSQEEYLDILTGETDDSILWDDEYLDCDNIRDFSIAGTLGVWINFY